MECTASSISPPTSRLFSRRSGEMSQAFPAWEWTIPTEWPPRISIRFAEIWKAQPSPPPSPLRWRSSGRLRR